MANKSEDYVKLVDEAKKYKDIFTVSTAKEAKRSYLKLARAVHPDYLPEGMKNKGNTLFNKLTSMYHEFLLSLEAGSGAKGESKAKKSSPLVFSTKKNHYVALSKDGQLSYDEVVKTFEVEYKDKEKVTRTGFLSLPVNHKDNDLVENGFKNLKKIIANNDKLAAFYPDVVDKGLFKISGKEHFGFVNNKLAGDWFSLKEVADIFNSNLQGRDVAWIFKRLLVSIGNAYDTGFVHANVNEDSILINPQAHGLVLRDWHYSVEAGDTLKAVNSKHKGMYTKASLNKKAVDYNLDIKMAAETMLKVSSAELPKKLAVFFEGCKYSTPHPAVLLNEFNEVLYEVYGTPRFHEMKIS